MNQKVTLSPIPTGLPLVRRLAILWVFNIEFNLNPDTMHPDAYKSLLDLLTKQEKNPMYWTIQECDEFLSSIIIPPPSLSSTFQILPQ